MATDGMWDVVTNSEVQRELQTALDDLKDAGDKKQEIVHTKMAKTLVELARGVKKDGFWEKIDGNLASGYLFTYSVKQNHNNLIIHFLQFSGDDISVFVIPLHNFTTM